MGPVGAVGETPPEAARAGALAELVSPGGERVTAASSWPPWSLWGTARAAACYPTLQKMLLQLGGKRDPNSFLSIIQWLELPGPPTGAWRKILAEASCHRTTWAGAKAGAWGAGRGWGWRGGLADASAGTSVLCLRHKLHSPFSRPLLFRALGPATRVRLGQGLA